MLVYKHGQKQSTMATGVNPLYLYTWRLPYNNNDFDPQKKSIVIYNYAYDRDSARVYVVEELRMMKGQEITIDKLNRGEIYPVHAFLTDEVNKQTTDRVYTYDKLSPGERQTDEAGKRTKNTNGYVWRREADPALATDKKERENREPSSNTGLKFREYIFQDVDDPEFHYIAKTIVHESTPVVENQGTLKRGKGYPYPEPGGNTFARWSTDDYIEYALRIIQSNFRANKPISMEVKNHPGDLHTGVRMGLTNRPGVLEIVKVQNWGYKESNIKSKSAPQSVETYKVLKDKRVAARKRKLNDKRKKKRDEDIGKMGKEVYYAERREKRNKNREARQLAGGAPGTQTGVVKAELVKSSRSKNTVDIGLDEVPSKYRV